MAILTVDLGDRSYPIHVDAGLLKRDEFIREFIAGSEVMVVSDETVAPLYLDQLLAPLAGMRVTCQILPCGENTKSLYTITQLFDTMLEASCSRSVTVIALGGGVIGDIAGFVAACYHRGVEFLQIPTTLLSQVDSAVGGKTGINHALGKNMIGAFHQPRCVIADIDTLATYWGTTNYKYELGPCLGGPCLPANLPNLIPAFDQKWNIEVLDLDANRITKVKIKEIK